MRLAARVLVETRQAAAMSKRREVDPTNCELPRANAAAARRQTPDETADSLPPPFTLSLSLSGKSASDTARVARNRAAVGRRSATRSHPFASGLMLFPVAGGSGCPTRPGGSKHAKSGKRPHYIRDDGAQRCAPPRIPMAYHLAD